VREPEQDPQGAPPGGAPRRAMGAAQRAAQRLRHHQPHVQQLLQLLLNRPDPTILLAVAFSFLSFVLCLLGFGNGKAFRNVYRDEMAIFFPFLFVLSFGYGVEWRRQSGGGRRRGGREM